MFPINPSLFVHLEIVAETKFASQEAETFGNKFR